MIAKVLSGELSCMHTGLVFETLSVPCRAPDKREYLVVIGKLFCLFCIKTYIVTPHQNRLDETVQMRGHNIWFH